ncbi:MAG: hypothetical protein RIA63_07670, partial [Cyclobacteriaceae bacterium]
MMGWDCNSHYTKHFAEILNPLPKLRPRCITNRLGKMSIPDHVPHLQILIGYQVARLDYAPRQLYGEVFTLPTYFKVFSTQAISCLDSVVRTLLGFRQSALQSLERLFAFTQVSRVLNCIAFAIGQEMVQSHIQPNSFKRWFSPFYSLLVNAKLRVVPIGTTHNPHPLELFQLVEMQVTSSPEFESSCFKSVAKSDITTVTTKLPAASFIL